MQLTIFSVSFGRDWKTEMPSNEQCDRQHQLHRRACQGIFSRFYDFCAILKWYEFIQRAKFDITFIIWSAGLHFFSDAWNICRLVNTSRSKVHQRSISADLQIRTFIQQFIYFVVGAWQQYYYVKVSDALKTFCWCLWCRFHLVDFPKWCRSHENHQSIEFCYAV